MNNRGDTIVEVIMAMAIVGLILTSSYAIANRSLLAARQAQERTEALKITESQIEKIKSLASTNFTALNITTSIYCIDESLVVKQISLGTIPARTSPNFTRYEQPGVNCVDTSGLYHFAIQYSGAPQDQFTVSTQWTTAGGGDTDEVKIVYRVHP